MRPVLAPLGATVVPAVLILLSIAWSVRADFTSAQKTELVTIHNRLREAVYPTATKMNFVTWNTRLESLAQAAAVKCIGDHNYGGDYAGLGENIYTGFRTNATEIVLAWHIEKAAYSYATAKCDTTGMSPLSSCGHYLQLVTDSVLEIGCGHKLCGTNNNMVFCEYGSGSASPPYASGTDGCSKCSTGRGLCLNGLCVNSSMLALADVLAYDSTASAASTSCKLNCSNCGVSASIAGVLDCYCNCPSSVSSGAFCDTRVANSQLSCSVCSQLGTPCLNGGVDSNGTSCSCQCPNTHVGKQCQIYRQFYLNGVRLGISAQQFCAFGQCVGVPVTRTVFKTAIWSRLQTAIVTAVNTYCNSNSASYSVCCSTGQLPATAKPLVAATDVGYLDNADLETDNSGMLGVVVYVNVTSASNTLCPSSRRKRAVTQQPMLSQAGLQSAIEQSNGTISGALGACCGASVQSAGSYQSYASAKYGISDVGGAAARAFATSLLWLLCLSCSVGVCHLAASGLPV